MKELENILNENNNAIWFVATPELIKDFQNLPQFISCRLDVYDNITCDEKELKIIPIKENTKFVGKTYLHSIMKIPALGYITICGVFDGYTDK